MVRNLKIIVDKNIPFIKGVLEPFAQITYIEGSNISNADVKNADALIIRTRTHCNEALLKGSNIRFIASSTIGTDHIDAEYCKANNIDWVNAPGCNSGSVMQYIGSVLMHLKTKYDLILSELTIGVVGYGNVGSKVVNLASAMGMRVLINDPPLQREGGIHIPFHSLDFLMAEADIICFHVPLNRSGLDKTFHLADESFFKRLAKKPFIINSSRGEVHDSGALKYALKNNLIRSAVLDVWENEPLIDLELLDMTEIATPHIAGYSADGKANGTAMSINAISKHFGLDIHPWFPSNIPTPNNINLTVENVDQPEEAVLSDLILSTYDVKSDDNMLRNDVASFEAQRAEYPLRREFQLFNVQLSEHRKSLEAKLLKLGFNVVAD